MPARWRLEHRVAGLLDRQRRLVTRISRLALIALTIGLLGTAAVLAGARLSEQKPEAPAVAPEPKATSDLPDVLADRVVASMKKQKLPS